MSKIIIEETEVNSIPVVTIYPEGATSLPLVFFIHGYGADKEQGIDFGYRAAKEGMCFVAFDCREHGIRKTEQQRRFTDVYPPDTGMDTYIHMHEIIEQAGKDVDSLIEHFKDYKEIDSERIGVTGFSMGAFATFYIAANNRNIKAAAPIAGKPAFKKAWEDVLFSSATYKQWAEDIEKLTAESEQRMSYMAQLDPFDKMAEFAPRPLLIINGDQDTDQLFLYSLELYKMVKPFYKEKPNQLKLSMPFMDHILSHGAKKEVCTWFKNFL